MDADANVFLTHYVWAAIVVYLMNKAKSAAWFPLVQKDKVLLNRAVSAVVAFAVGIGIHYAWSAGPNGEHQLVLMIPSWAALAQGLWHWVSQYAMQESVFQMTKT